MKISLITFGIFISLCYFAPLNAQTTTSRTLLKDKKMDDKTTVTLDRGCIVRGPRDKKQIALEFTGGHYADGGTTILKELKKYNAKASFFFVGDFYREPKFQNLIKQIKDDGHYLGPHSDKHPLYASWDNPPKLEIDQATFSKDLDDNMKELERFGIAKHDARFFVPPFEHYTQEISDWTAEKDMVLINLTRGTLSHTDYMEDSHPRYVPSEKIIQSILDFEEKDPDGLNGFLLLMHIGAGPERTKDHLYNHLGGLLETLSKKGYTFVRVDELLTR